MKNVVIVSACRTAIGAFGGTLKSLNGAVLASVTMQEAVRQANIDPSIIDDVRYGCCMEPVDALNVTRTAALLAGIPDAVTAATPLGSAKTAVAVASITTFARIACLPLRFTMVIPPGALP